MHSGTWVLPKESYSARITGTCLCGAVEWSYDAPFERMFHCHCSLCRKHHGTLFITTVVGPLDTFRWRSGTEKVGAWRSSVQETRRFCATCGSKVPRVEQETRSVFMPAGGLRGELGIRPQMHLFVASKPEWHGISDSLPQYEAYPPGWSASAVETSRRVGREGVCSGSCACGHVRFELEGPPMLMMHCHCSRCRRARGAAHATNLAWKLDALRYLEGEELATVFDLPDAQFFGTTFCSRCGGFLPRRSPGRGWAVVPSGSLDSNPGVQPRAHIHVASKAAWFDITDDLPQFSNGAA
jgi:hypothetical protein